MNAAVPQVAGATAATPLISIVDGLLAPYLVDRSALGLGIWSVGC